MNFFFPNMYTFFENTTLYQFFFLNYWLFLNLDTFFFGIIDDDMMMMMMNCFCDMVDRRKVFSLISSRDHCQRPSPSRISDTPQAGFELAQNLSSGLVKWSRAVVITTTTPLNWSSICLDTFVNVSWNASQQDHFLIENLPLLYTFVNLL